MKPNGVKGTKLANGGAKDFNPGCLVLESMLLTLHYPVLLKKMIFFSNLRSI